MGRPLRSDFEYAFHHVMNRAGARRNPFTSVKKRLAFLDILQHVVKSDQMEVHAYCLMGNHYHLLVRTPHGNLSAAMQRLASMFTKRFNRLEKIDGPLFRGRFKSIIVGNDEYLTQLCRYIHRNPVAAGIVQAPQEYEWSSYPVYAGELERPKWLICDELPRYFQGPDCLATMRDFIEQNDSDAQDKLSFDALLKQMRRAKKDPFTPSRCIQRPFAEEKKSSLSANLPDIIQSVNKYYKVESKTFLCPRPNVRNVARDLCIFFCARSSWYANEGHW